MVIHGWTPFWSPTPYSGNALMPNLENTIAARLNNDGLGSQWKADFRDWSPNSQGFPQTAVRNAAKVGDAVAQQIIAGGYTNVELISHSAGAWVANEIGHDLAAAGIPVSVTFLDAYTPSTVAFKFRSSDKLYTPEALGAGLAHAEHYYHTNWTMWGLGNTLPNAANYDVSPLQTCDGDTGDWHGWPVRWYTKTAANANYSCADNIGYSLSPCAQGGDGADNAMPSSASASPSSPQDQASSTVTVNPPAFLARRRLLNEEAPPPPPPLPPALSNILSALSRRTNMAVLQTTTVSAPAEIPAASSDSTTVPAGPQIPLTDLTFDSLTPIAQGGNGTLTTNADGVQLSTSDFFWETFGLATTNGFNLGALDYELSTNCNNIVGLWMDGQPMTLIQSAPQDPLASIESFPLSQALGAGNHNLTVSLQSLDGIPVSATLKELNFALTVSAPLITSQSISNGQFGISWEAGAGLKYQVQASSDLTSSNWTNIGPLLSSPTNAVMSAFDALGTNNQRFYRVQMNPN
jgi:hypothetical protein